MQNQKNLLVNIRHLFVFILIKYINDVSYMCYPCFHLLAHFKKYFEINNLNININIKLVVFLFIYF